MPKNPLAEVFGYPVGSHSKEAVSHRRGRLCPYHNSSGLNCTKVSATDPIGVCTIHNQGKVVATCPVRFREDFKIVSDAADFFFPGKTYVALTEVRLKDEHEKSAGNIDIVLAALDKNGHIADFGAIEVQAVYITGNVTNVFKKYMKNPAANHDLEWPKENYPHPDFLSSSRKRLAPQLIYKGGIMHAWGKKMVVVVDESFFEQLPDLKETGRDGAEIAWLVYTFVYDKVQDRYTLKRRKTKYTKFAETLERITKPAVGDIGRFVKDLETRIKRGKTMGVPNATPLAPEVEPLQLPLVNGD